MHIQTMSVMYEYAPRITHDGNMDTLQFIFFHINVVYALSIAITQNVHLEIWLNL